MLTELETVRFGCFTLDTRCRTLMAADKPVPLHARAFDILVYLIKHRDRPVPHTEILAHVWNNRVVAENNLSVQLSSLRKALAEAGEHRPLILTLPERNYRFVGQLDQSETQRPHEVNNAVTEPPLPIHIPPQGRTVAPRQPQTFWLTLGFLTAMAVGIVLVPSMLTNPPRKTTPRLSMVVLPFRNTSPDRTQDYLADEITDDLTADLARIPASTVIARQSAEVVQHEPAHKIGSDLNVRYIVSGNLVPEDGKYHVTATLIEARSGKEIWVAQLDRTRDRMSEVRGEIVRQLAAPLHIELDRAANLEAIQDRPDNPDALDLFFRARSQLDSGSSLEIYSSAAGLLEQAISKQADFTDAKALLGWTLLGKLSNWQDSDEARDHQIAKRLTREALAASPQNLTALSSRAWDYMLEGRCAEAKPISDRVLGVDPSNINVRLVLAGCAMDDFHLDEAGNQYQDIIRLDPQSPNIYLRYVTLGTIRLVQGKYEDALKWLTLSKPGEISGSSMDPPELSQVMLISAYELIGKHDQARNAYVAYKEQHKWRTTWRVSTYFPDSWRRSAEFQTVLKSLQQSGMPEFSDENADSSDGQICLPGDFSSTPNTLNGGSVMNADEFQTEMRRKAPKLIIDYGLGAVAGRDWVHYNKSSTSENPDDFAESKAKEFAKSDHTVEIVIFGAGPTGCTAYSVAQHLIALGYSHVAYFRGGEEALAKVGYVTGPKN